MIVVYIQWTDSNIWDGQHSRKDMLKVEIINTCGFLIEETDKYITVSRDVMSISSDDVRGTITIPRENVIKYQKGVNMDEDKKVEEGEVEIVRTFVTRKEIYILLEDGTWEKYKKSEIKKGLRDVVYEK